MTKATKNGATFETINLAEGKWYIARKGDYAIDLYPCGDYYLATLCGFTRPLINAEGNTPKWALHQLTLAAKQTAWTEEGFFEEVFFPLAKDLNEWLKRPARETYNSR